MHEPAVTDLRLMLMKDGILAPFETSDDGVGKIFVFFELNCGYDVKSCIWDGEKSWVALKHDTITDPIRMHTYRRYTLGQEQQVPVKTIKRAITKAIPSLKEDLKK